jgi:hypothetical protein
MMSMNFNCGNSKLLGHVREERANISIGNLHHGELITQETEASSKVDAITGDDGDVGASLSWADTAATDSDDRGVCLHRKYRFKGWAKYQRKRALTAALPVRKASTVGAALATLAVVATMASAKRQRKVSPSIVVVENSRAVQELLRD